MTMKVVGVWTIVIGLGAALVFAVLPATLTVPAGSVSCGIPSRVAYGHLPSYLDGTSSQDVEYEHICESESKQRIVAASVFALAGVIIGGVIGLAGQREEDSRLRFSIHY